MLGTAQYFILPYMEQGNTYNQMAVNHYDTWYCVYGIKTYIGPADPTEPPSGKIDTGSPRFGTSYAPNEWVFDPQTYPSVTNLANLANHTQIPGNGSSPNGQTAPFARIPGTIQDGLSQTIFFAEKYAVCGNSSSNVATFYWGETGGACNRTGGQGGNGSIPGFYTITQPPQPQPNPFSTCNPCMLQATYAGGILVGLGDGSCRLVNSSVSAATWANAVQPADGNVLGNDW